MLMKVFEPASHARFRFLFLLFCHCCYQGVRRGPGDEDHGQLQAQRRHPHREQTGAEQLKQK